MSASAASASREARTSLTSTLMLLDLDSSADLMMTSWVMSADTLAKDSLAETFAAPVSETETSRPSSKPLISTSALGYAFSRPPRSSFISALTLTETFPLLKEIPSSSLLASVTLADMPTDMSKKSSSEMFMFMLALRTVVGSP